MTNRESRKLKKKHPKRFKGGRLHLSWRTKKCPLKQKLKKPITEGLGAGPEASHQLAGPGKGGGAKGIAR